MSSGERQLGGLARIALLDSEVLVLDEPTATLDLATEELVNHAVGVLMETRTSLSLPELPPSEWSIDYDSLDRG